MIPRYEVKEIAQIWSAENRYQKFLDVEIALLKALEAKNKIPQGTSAAYKNVEIRPNRVDELEAVTKHDVIAFTTSITEQVSPDVARFFHFGATSSDILDTALTLQVRESLNLVKTDLEALLAALKTQVESTRDILCMGRSHGMFAEPMIFAQKFLMAFEEFKTRLSDYQELQTTALTGLFSGAVGNYTVLSPEIEELALKELNLKPEKVSSQVLPRHHLAKIVSNGALLAAGLERLAVEMRLLQHSDINEVQEGFSAGQKGSSTMPHKRNPISSENITGLSRMIRSHVDISLENCVLWHERDISHSSTERMYLPDHFGLLSYALKRMTTLIKNLVIHRERIEEKVFRDFSVLSSYTLHQMILLNEVTREELYTVVQSASFQSKNAEEFYVKLSEIARDKKLKAPDFLKPEALKSHYMESFKKIETRVFTI